MTTGTLDTANSSSAADRPSLITALLGGGTYTFAIFLAFAFGVLAFALLTVFSGHEPQLANQPLAGNSKNIISYWQAHGYLYSGGLIHVDGAKGNSAGAYFWRSSTGAYLVSGYIVEKIATLISGHYSRIALAIHNLVIVLLTSALLAMLVYLYLTAIGVERVVSLILAGCVELVMISFPDFLAAYWGIVPQVMAIPFALLVLILDRSRPSNRRLLLQAVTAFALLYSEYVYGTFFFVAYWLFQLAVERTFAWRRFIIVSVLPTLAVLVVFSAQLMVNRAHYPNVPLEGSDFLVRTGLDGSSQYYGEHSDLMFGRNTARANFPANRPYLFTWEVLFIAGCLGTALLTLSAVKRSVSRNLLHAFGTLIGAYVLYAAVFSQAVVIHPYQYDSLLAMPLIAIVFGFVPGVAELLRPSRGILVALVVFVAAWYAMVEMRNYALRYPLSATPAANAATGTPATPVGSVPGQWSSVAYNASNLAVDRGHLESAAADQAVYRYTIIGNTMLLHVGLQSLTSTGNPTEIRVAIPGGHVAATGAGGAALVNNNGAWAVSRYYTGPDFRYVAVLPTPTGGSFAACRRCVYLHFSATLEVK